MGNTPTVAINGQTIRIKSPVAEGGHGSVFVAEDVATRQKYALKVTRAPKDDSTLNHVLEMEAELHAQLGLHHNLVRYIGSKIDRTAESVCNVYYLLTEYCPKTVFAALEQVVKKKDSLPEREIMNIFTSALVAVRHLHANHIAHRDIKVENLLYGPGDGEVKLCDLGSCSTDHRVLRNSTEIGYAKEDIERHTTIAYRAPEQVDLYSQKLICEKVDVWALGVLLFKLCYFKTPFEDKMGTVSPMAILNVSYKIPPSPAYAPGLASLIKYMLQPDPDARPTATQVLRRVRELMSTGELSPNPDLPALAALSEADELPTSPLPRLAVPVTFSPPPSNAPTTPGTAGGASSTRPPTGRHGSLDLSAASSVATPSFSPSPHSVASPVTTPRSTLTGGGLRSPPPMRVNTPPATGGRGAGLKFGDSVFGQEPSSASSHDEAPPAIPDISDLQTVNRARTPPGYVHRRDSSNASSLSYDEQGRPRNPKKALGELWQKRMMRIMGGGEGGKKSWVVKATSKEAGPPKAKYVRKIVLAVWEHEVSSSTFFINLYQRPVQGNPVVALKGLITTLKLLQQGPRDFLSECVPCVGMIDEIGKHWGAIATKMTAEPSKEHLPRQSLSEGYTSTPFATTHLAGGQSPSSRRSFLDVDSVALIQRFAHLLVLKLNFHDQHPEFATHFTAVPTMLGYDTVPVTGSSQDMNALSRLLTIQDAIIQTQRLVFAARNDNVQTTARWSLMPLIEEAYTVFVACTFLLASLLELCARSTAAAPISRLHVTALLGLRSQYEAQLAHLQDFYKHAERVEEVRLMRRMPHMPVSTPVALDGALNWKPSTMKSPVRSLGLCERARIKEEMRDDPSPDMSLTGGRSQGEDPSSLSLPDPIPPPNLTTNWESFGTSAFHTPSPTHKQQQPPQQPPPLQQPSEEQQQAQAPGWFLPSTVVPEPPVCPHVPPPPDDPFAGLQSMPSGSSGLLGVAPSTTSGRGGRSSSQAISSSPPTGLEDFLRSTAPAYQPQPPPQPQAVEEASPHHFVPVLKSAVPMGGAAPAATPLLQQPQPVIPPGPDAASFASLGVALRSATPPLPPPPPPPQEAAPAPAVAPAAPPPQAQPQPQLRVPSKDRDAWSAFLNDPNEASIDDSSGQQQDGSRQQSVDLLNWSTNDDSDESDDSDGDDSDGAVVALNTSTMSNIMAPRRESSPPPKSPPRVAPPVEDRETRARRREARSQPWRQNMKPVVAAALALCIRQFEGTGTLVRLEEIVLGEVIGHGAFATVYRGHCRGQDVAVKKLVTQNGLPMAEKSVRDFASEVALLQQLHHPNIITLVGTCIDPIALLTEFCHRGNLFVVLNETNKYPELAWERKLSFALGLAEGMHYLHTRDPILIHRDLKSLNVLINRDWRVKVTDFGLSRFKPHSLSDIMTMQCGTYHWMAPEVINSTTYTEKADVYSYGVILWEIYARAIPYNGMNPMQVAAAVVNRMERPPIPADCPPEYADLVRACWAQDAADRPSFSEVIETIKAIPL